MIAGVNENQGLDEPPAIDGDSGSPSAAPDFLSLAGSMPVPEAKREAAWDEVLGATRATRAANRRW